MLVLAQCSKSELLLTTLFCRSYLIVRLHVVALVLVCKHLGILRLPSTVLIDRIVNLMVVAQVLVYRHLGAL